MLEPVVRTPLSQTILDEIIKAIKSNHWEPGSRIPSEQELAATFSVSRNSIREAVKTLNSMKVLESRPGLGTFLSKDALRHILSSELIDKGFKDATLQDINDIRSLLEAQSAYWAAERATDDDLETMREILERCRESRAASMEVRDEVHFAFHEAVIRVARNAFVSRLLTSLQAEIDAQRSHFFNVPPHAVSELIEDQEEIIGCILDRNPEAAREAMKRHMEKGLRLIRMD